MCSESSEQALELVRHYERCHPAQPKPPNGPFFDCYVCKCHLKNSRAVRKHLKHHVAARDTKCQICHESFTSNELIEWHICGSDDAKRSHITCEYCDQSFQSVLQCMQHLEMAHPDRTLYRCRKCTASKCYGMKLLKNLHEKYSSHTVKKFQCAICSRRFATKIQIKTHMQKHSTNGKHFFCMVFYRNSKVSRYCFCILFLPLSLSLIASLCFPFLCSECGKRYASKRTLLLHQLKHAEPTIQCPECPAKFHTEPAFTQHYDVHRNLNYKCSGCKSTFRSQRSLVKHMRKLIDSMFV